jgi:anti-sigma regulatory factor (Ser/Thr protein kinase)
MEITMAKEKEFLTGQQIHLPIQESSQVADARQKGVTLAKNLGFQETETGKVAIVITEATQNLVKHAKGGELFVRPLLAGGIEVIALDRGPGISNMTRFLQDGFSSAGSAGTGLGAISRLSDVFDIFSLPGKGTVLVAQLWPKSFVSKIGQHLEEGVICVPKLFGEPNGDGWSIEKGPEQTFILVADGLGHGPFAARAAQEAKDAFYQNIHLSPAGILEAINLALRGTRGAAVAVAEVRRTRQAVRFAGVGNISGVILSSEGIKNMVSYNGTAGAEVSKIREFTYDWPKGALLILHSDGLKSHWSLNGYPGLVKKHPGLIAGVLYRDYSRGSDDTIVLAAGERERTFERERAS